MLAGQAAAQLGEQRRGRLPVSVDGVAGATAGRGRADTADIIKEMVRPRTLNEMLEERGAERWRCLEPRGH